MVSKSSSSGDDGSNNLRGSSMIGSTGGALGLACVELVGAFEDIRGGFLSRANLSRFFSSATDEALAEAMASPLRSPR